MRTASVVSAFFFLLLIPATAPAQECSPAPDGLVSWWPGDGNANDLQGPNHGTLMHGTTFAAGRVGQAFWLDGSNDYVGGIGTASTFSFIQNTGVFTGVVSARAHGHLSCLLAWTSRQAASRVLCSLISSVKSGAKLAHSG